MSFRFRPRLGVSYERQGLVYFVSRTYTQQPKRVQEKIERLCRDCGGEHWRALFEFVTTDEGAVSIGLRHHVSEGTLYRAVRGYYRAFAHERG